jgi:DNA-binding transcriptional LysR family regulator
MELRLLRTFKAVADAGSFTRAGLRVNLSQAAVSFQIKALEEEIGARLFARVKKQVVLTPVGEVLLRHAETILRAHDEARAEIARLTQRGRTVLRIGTASTMLSIHPLPEILSELKKRFPLLDVTVFGGTSEAIVRRILDGRLDVGIISLPVDAPLIETEPLYGDRLVAVVAPSHPLATVRQVTAAQLASEALIVSEKGGNRRRLIEAFFEKAGLKPRVAMELNRDEAIKKMIERGLGISLLPWLTVHQEVKAGRLRALPVRGLKQRWEVGLAYRKSETPTPAFDAFVELCHSFLGPSRLRRKVSVGTPAPARPAAPGS